ncbi:MAG: hypothetical protein KDA51_03135, partial [Planctomycetales bacterium]|nr:hypothetical protein [Planctomycetales bacterium]
LLAWTDPLLSEAVIKIVTAEPQLETLHQSQALFKKLAERIGADPRARWAILKVGAGPQATVVLEAVRQNDELAIFKFVAANSDESSNLRRCADVRHMVRLLEERSFGSNRLLLVLKYAGRRLCHQCFCFDDELQDLAQRVFNAGLEFVSDLVRLGLGAVDIHWDNICINATDGSVTFVDAESIGSLGFPLDKPAHTETSSPSSSSASASSSPSKSTRLSSSSGDMQSAETDDSEDSEMSASPVAAPAVSGSGPSAI